MNKQDLKSLLENIYHLLAEDAPPPTAEEPRGTVTPTIPPEKTGAYQTSFYDRASGGPAMPIYGPFSPNHAGVGSWQDAFHNWQPLWPPPTGLVPDGPGGMWMMSSNPQCPQCGFQYWYVYPQNPNGTFNVHEYFLQFPGQFQPRTILGQGWN